MSDEQDTKAGDDARDEAGERDEGDDRGGDKPRDERIEQVEEHIEQAKADSDEAIHGSFYEGDQGFYSSGDTEEEDDQTIAPPG
jgi:hypothetical protein